MSELSPQSELPQITELKKKIGDFSTLVKDRGVPYKGHNQFKVLPGPTTSASINNPDTSGQRLSIHEVEELANKSGGTERVVVGSTLYVENGAVDATLEQEKFFPEMPVTTMDVNPLVRITGPISGLSARNAMALSQFIDLKTTDITGPAVSASPVPTNA